MEKNHITRLYTAADTIWEVIIAKRRHVKWCKTTILEYKEQLNKLFDSHSALREKATLFSTLQNNKTISNEVFDSQIVGKEKEDNDETRGIDNELGALSEKDNDNEPVCKKAKIVKKKLELDLVEKASTQSKGKKKSAGVELT